MVRTLVRTTLLILIGLGLASCHNDKDTWDTTCLMYDAFEASEGRAEGACNQVDAPVVVYEEMRDGLWGYYDGGDTIFINSELAGMDQQATLIHEGVHYLDAQWLGLVVPGPAAEICASEDKAWLIEGVWWEMHDRPENARPEWWRSYPWCWQYYAPSTFTLTLQEYVDIMEIGDEEVTITITQ